MAEQCQTCESLQRACTRAASTLLRVIHMAVAVVRFSLALRTLVGGKRGRSTPGLSFGAPPRPQVCRLGPRPDPRFVVWGPAPKRRSARLGGLRSIASPPAVHGSRSGKTRSGWGFGV